jgi:hypothetical protein
LLHPAAFPVYPQDILWHSAFRPGLGPASSAFPIFQGGRLRRRLGGSAPALVLCLTTFLESDGYPVAYAADKCPFAGTLKPLFKVSDPLVEVEVEWRRSRFDLEEPDWSGSIGTAHYTEALRLSSGEVPGDSLDLLCSGVMPYSGTIGDCTTDPFVYISLARSGLHPHADAASLVRANCWVAKYRDYRIRGNKDRLYIRILN